MSRIKECFTSRFEGGSIVQVDFSQLEVVALAFLSGDEVLKGDIRDGVDMHCMSASFLYSKDYHAILHAYKSGDPTWTHRRKKAKAPGFLIQYGGSATTMAHSTGLTRSQCQVFIDNYYSRYKQVKLWQDDIAKSVLESRLPSAKFVGGVQAGMSVLKSITGRRYVFYEQEAPKFLKDRGTPLSFSPTQMKNYPVQGFATGDIVPLMIGKVYRWIKNNYPDVLMVNTIHDSIMFDVPPHIDIREFSISLAEATAFAPTIIEDTFGFEFDLPLPVDVEHGPSWAEVDRIVLT